MWDMLFIVLMGSGLASLRAILDQKPATNKIKIEESGARAATERGSACLDKFRCRCWCLCGYELSCAIIQSQDGDSVEG